MSEDLIKVIELLINSNKGDPQKLQQILDLAHQGKPIEPADQQYISDLTSIKDTEDLTNMPNPIEMNSPDAKQNDVLVETPQHPTEIKGKSRSFSSQKKAALACAVITAVIVAYAILDTYSVSALQFRPHHGNEFAISPTEVRIQADVCNPSFFPASFNKYEITAFYKSQEVETAQVPGITVGPNGFSTLDGVFSLNMDTINKLRQANETFDPVQAHVTTKVDAPIFGIIPYSFVTTYPAEQFQEIIKNGPPGSFSCKGI